MYLSQAPHLVLIFFVKNKLPPQPSCSSQLSPKPRCIHKSGLFKWNEIHFSGLNFVLWFPRGAHSGPFPFKWLCSVTLAYISLHSISRSHCVCMYDSVEAKVLVSVFSKSSSRLKPITSNSMSHQSCHREQFYTVFLCRGHNAAVTHNQSVCSSLSETWGWWCGVVLKA